MSYYLTHYQGTDFVTPVQISEYPNLSSAILHLEEITGPNRLWEALEAVFSDQIWWWDETTGWAITAESPELGTHHD